MSRRPTPAERARLRADAALAAPPPRFRGLRAAILSLELVIAGRRYPISEALDGDTPWELTTDGAASITLPIRSPDESLVRALADEAQLQRDGVSVRIDATNYVLASVSSDGAGLFTLVFEDEVAWRLRQFTRFIAATRETVTRAGFVQRMVEEASRPPRASMRSFIPQVRDVQPIARAAAP